MTSTTLKPRNNKWPTGLRSIYHNNTIRVRPCMDDENFCSIVSIVRLEFVQENLYQKFWALERNCSKSCNTGCMLIGERVRLRVCSQCCRTPNCNLGSSSTSVHSSILTPMFNHILSQLTSLAGYHDSYKHIQSLTYYNLATMMLQLLLYSLILITQIAISAKVISR